ncbi:glycosyltransferase [Microbacterium stercoris]|uniref:Glycosyltransferase n=1 Tax=Microbacterium stercoris TaxID=2820289 RepID=A0A939TRX9_9MICO|nr:glycosyltransferase [Microbacterium stercoris]MBO3664980.1 glycosyltransferase [Microbacterium stercoris]
MNARLVDLVIACHDESRPLERAVASVLADSSVRDRVRVTVVAHGIPAAPLEHRLAGIEGEWRVVEFADGVRSAAGPYNHGLGLADAEYCAVMGSDDSLEPGALAGWISAAEARRPDAAIARIRIAGQPIMPNPLVRIGRRHDLDPARDRLFYRTAPLGLIRTETMRRMGLRMTEGVRVGEDLDFSVRLFALADRVDFLGDAPCYVIGEDARERTTLAPMRLEDDLAAVTRLLDSELPGLLSPADRRALAIKLVRVSIVGKVRARPTAAQWSDEKELAFLAELLRRLVSLAPGVLAPFNLQDRALLDVLLGTPDLASVLAAVEKAARAGRLQRWFTRNPLRAFGRETSLRRYVLYLLNRERTNR